MLEYTLVDTVWGAFGLLVEGDAVAATFLPMPAPAARTYVARRWPDAKRNDRLLPHLQTGIKAYFRGERVDLRVAQKLDHAGAFGRRVLAACSRIPYGQTASYQDLARAAGSPAAARAVGSVMAANRCPLLIPCHRVVRADGSIGGFSSPEGVEQKRRLLSLEGAAADLPLLAKAAAG